MKKFTQRDYMQSSMKRISLSVAIAYALICALFLIMGLIMDAKRANAAEGTTGVKAVYAIKFDNIAQVKNPNRDYLIMVNNQNKYEFGGYYDINIQKDLAYCVNDVDGDTMAAEKAAYLAYTMLKRDMAAEGIKIGIYDGYRTAADQEYLIGLLRTPTNPVADVGCTECHTGLLLSIVVWDDNKGAWAETLDDAKVRANFEKMHARAADYGFIVRYPEEKESVTGLSYRPSNMRFVGSAEVAHAIMCNGLTLEEYKASLGK